MSALRKLERPAALGLRAAAVLLVVAPLLTRAAVGFGFYETGKGKLANAEGTAAFFASLKLPFPAQNAAFVSRLEYYGGLMLMAGLLTRVVGALLTSTMLVALATAHRDEVVALLTGAADAPAVMDIAPLPFLIGLLWLVACGPGVASVDRLLFHRLGTRKDEPT
jgi:putative oxidoreductase